MNNDNDNERLPSSRKDAELEESVFFFTGGPCRNGHVAPRYTSSKGCVVCCSESAARRKKNAPEKWRQQRKAQRDRSFERNPERRRRHTREFMRKWRAENPELASQKMREWREANPEKSREHSANNNARRRSAEGNFSSEDIERLLNMQRHRCAECNKSVKSGYHVDHIMPLSRGGTNWPSNLQILCPRCNQNKHAKDPIEWAQSKGRLL